MAILFMAICAGLRAWCGEFSVGINGVITVRQRDYLFFITGADE